jgi:hypothetical protein
MLSNLRPRSHQQSRCYIDENSRSKKLTTVKADFLDRCSCDSIKGNVLPHSWCMITDKLPAERATPPQIAIADQRRMIIALIGRSGSQSLSANWTRQKACRSRTKRTSVVDHAKLERRLEISLEDTFPASDPVAVLEPAPEAADEA